MTSVFVYVKLIANRFRSARAEPHVTIQYEEKSETRQPAKPITHYSLGGRLLLLCFTMLLRRLEGLAGAVGTFYFPSAVIPTATVATLAPLSSSKHDL